MNKVTNVHQEGLIVHFTVNGRPYSYNADDPPNGPHSDYSEYMANQDRISAALAKQHSYSTFEKKLINVLSQQLLLKTEHTQQWMHCAIIVITLYLKLPLVAQLLEHTMLDWAKQVQHY